MTSELTAMLRTLFPDISAYHVLVLKEYAYILPVLLLAVAPGLGFAGIAARRVRFSWPETIVLAFAFSLAWVSLTATAAHFLHLTFTVVWALFLALIPVSVWFFVHEWRSGHLDKPPFEWQGLAVALVGVAAAAVQRPWFWGGSDTFYHIAASRSLLATDAPLVTDPFFATGIRTLDPTSGTWHTYQALISRTLNQDLAVLYLAFTALGTAMVLLAFWILARRVSDSATAASVATFVYALGAWAFDFRALAYPKHFSLSLAFLCVLLLIRILDKPSKRLVAVTVVVGLAAVMMHLGSAQLTLLVIPGLVFFALVLHLLLRRQGVDWGRRSIYLLLVTFALIVLVSIPVLLIKTSALSGSSVLEPTGGGTRSLVWIGGQMPLVEPGQMHSIDWWIYWPSFLILPLAIAPAFGKREPHALAAFALVAMPFLLLTNPFVTPLAVDFSVYVLGRVAELLRFVPFVGIAWALGRLRADRRAVAGWLGVVLAVVAVAGSIPYLMWTFGREGIGRPRAGYLFAVNTSQRQDLRRSWGEKTMREMQAEMGGRYPVVAATEATGYYLIGFLPLAVVAAPPSHSPAAIETVDGVARRRDMVRFFAPSTSAEERREIVREHDIEYVIVRDIADEAVAEQSMLAQPELFKRVIDTPRLDMLEVVGE